MRPRSFGQLRDEGKPLWISENLAQEPGIGTDPRNGDLLFANMGLGKIRRLQRKP